MIRVVAICIFRRGNAILVAEGFDSVKQERFARPLGGAVEMGETSAQTIVREIQEEINQEVIDLKRLGVLENLFTHEGRHSHEIMFVYEGRFADPSVYNHDAIAMNEPGWTSPAVWRPLASFGPDCRLVPEGLAAML